MHCTPRVAKTKKLWNSRRWSRPITESMSALGRNTPPIGHGEESSAGGASSGLESTCCLKSGEAQSRNQTLESGENAICVCVRGRAFNLPRRSPLQFEQWQFHWGNPPPAADPRTFTRIPLLQPNAWSGRLEG